MTDVLRAAVYGHLVGDAIGVPYEFTAPDASRAVELRGFGSHHQPAGTWSDDGALMLDLLDSLVSAGFYPEDISADEIRRYLEARPAERPRIESLCTIIRRDGDALAAIPYSEAYAEWLKPAAEEVVRFTFHWHQSMYS